MAHCMTAHYRYMSFAKGLVHQIKGDKALFEIPAPHPEAFCKWVHITSLEFNA